MRLLALAAAAASLLAACVTTASAAGPSAAPTPAPAPARSWALPQIKAVVEAGLLAPSVAAFRPDERLTQSALADALEALALRSEDGAVSRYRTTSPARAVTIRELDAALVAFVGLGAAAREITAELKLAGLEPKTGAGTETVARLLGLRINHPAADDAIELGPNDAATRAEAAYSLARVLDLSDWHRERVREQAAALTLPSLSDWQRRVLARAVRFVGFPYVWGGMSERRQTLFGVTSRGGFDCSGFVWRVYKLERWSGAPRLGSTIRGRTTYVMSGEVVRGARIGRAALRPADVIFFGNRGTRSRPADVTHTGMSLGGGWFVHSSGDGTTIAPLAGWYVERFAWARRPLAEVGLS
jgi:cell wall-associated NlpC family hydrolase